MAWQVKPSATTEIERRSEPYLTADMAARFKKDLLPRYEQPMGALLPIMHEIQHAYGYIPYQAMEEVAAFLDITPGDVLDTVTFYEEFHTEPVGRHIIAICQSITCEVCGHQTILDHLRRKLDIEIHETTDDGRFTLLALECLGACEGAPCALVNDQRHDHLTIERIDQILEQLPD